MSKTSAILALVAGVWGGMLQAQMADPMALQRCIWSCLSNSPGAHSPQYHQCVNQYCNAQQRAPLAPVAPAEPWKHGLASDNVSHFAGQTATAGGNVGFYYFCKPRSESYLALFGVFQQPGPLRLTIGSRSHTVYFNRARGQLTASVPAQGPLISDLSRGQWLSVRTASGRSVMEVPLQGASTALYSATASCFSNF